MSGVTNLNAPIWERARMSVEVKKGDFVTISPAMSEAPEAPDALPFDGAAAVVEGFRGNGRRLFAKVRIWSGPRVGEEPLVPFDACRKGA